jgi:hypothetical protein
LEISNPNYMAPPQLLVDATSSQKESHWTTPTESAIVDVPREQMLFALPSKIHNKALVDYTGEVFFHVWDHKMGAEVAKDMEIKLGGIADFVSTVENWYNPYTGAGENLENFTFRFDDGPPLLADIEGGDPIPKASDLKEPTEMLFLDAKGRMFMSNESRDAPVKDFYKERYTLETATAPTGGLIAPESPGILKGPASPYGGSR